MLCSLNIQSLPAKFNEFSDFISNLLYNNAAPEIICLQELWQIADPNLLSLPSYHPLLFKLRHNIKGGGVGIYIKDSLRFNLLVDLSVFIDRIFESIFIEVITHDNKKILIGCIYRPGSAHPTLTQSEQFTQFLEIFSNILSDISSKYDNVYICGDFNIDVLKCNSHKNIMEYIDLLYSYGLLQIITKPTRIASLSATLIDHVLTNVSSTVYETQLLTHKISDHFAIFHHINFSCPPPKINMVESRNFSLSNICKFQNAVRNFNWEHVTNCNDTQESFNNFSSTFLLFYNLYFPLRSVKFNRKFHKINPWMSSGILISRQKKINLCSLSIKNPTHSNIDAFKKYRNVFNSVVRASKKLYFETQLKNNSSNLKRTWQIINSAIKKPSKNCKNITEILIDGNLESDPKTVANYFNNFFRTAAVNIVNDINPSMRVPADSVPFNPVSFSLTNEPVTSTEINEACKLLEPKKSEDFNGISMFFIKKVILSISGPLKHIFNLSFSSGAIPNQLKIAKVIPIFKSGDKTLADNYRPISLLSCFSKILEKIVYIRLSKFLERCDILTKFQFGFRANHSTVHPMTKLLNFVSKALNEKKHAVALFCDLRKAFDSCDHSILLSKLEKMGIRNNELLWFKNYLTNRMQFVHVL